MRCRYLESDLCHSCTRANVAYAEQLAAKDAAVRELLERSARAKGAAAPEIEWDPPFASAEEGFRNKAKLAVGGTVSAPTLGILGSDRRGIDIAGCPLYEPAVASGIEPLREFIGLAGLTPFDVPTGRGELKSVILTGSPDGELMVRFILRSTESLVRIRKHMGWLRQRLPHIAVVSVNLLPERKAVLEGEEEILLGPEQSLRMDLGDVALRLRPQSFFQLPVRRRKRGIGRFKGERRGDEDERRNIGERGRRHRAGRLEGEKRGRRAADRAVGPLLRGRRLRLALRGAGPPRDRGGAFRPGRREREGVGLGRRNRRRLHRRGCPVCRARAGRRRHRRSQPSASRNRRPRFMDRRLADSIRSLFELQSREPGGRRRQHAEFRARPRSGFRHVSSHRPHGNPRTPRPGMRRPSFCRSRVKPRPRVPRTGPGAVLEAFPPRRIALK